jgi:rubrerythrin
LTAEAKGGDKALNDRLLHSELADVHVDEDSDDLSRSEVILKGALAAGAVYGVGMVGPFVRRALAMSEGGDIGVLNFLLAFERLEAAFYSEGFERAKGSDFTYFIGLISDYELQHDVALEAMIRTLGGKPVGEPKFDFSYSGNAGLLKLAEAIEETAVGAYNGAIPSLEDTEARALAGSIDYVEARTAAAIRSWRGKEPAPRSFDPPLSESQVRATIEKFKS